MKNLLLSLSDSQCSPFNTLRIATYTPTAVIMSSSNAKTTEEEENLPETSQDLTVFVQNLLEQMVFIMISFSC